MKNVFFILLLVTISVNIAFTQGSIIAKKVMPSVVLIVMEDDNGQMLGLGSGFFISKNIIATNFHVIEGATKGYIKFINNQNKINIDGVVGIDKEHDIVLLAVKTDSPFLNLGNFNNVETGQNVYVVGNPKGLEGTFSQGIVSSIRNIEEEFLLQITAPISPGSSGGPVLNTNGDVIGVSVASYKDGQNLNFAVPVSYLHKLINNMKDIVPINSTSTPKRSIFSKNIGNKITEGVIGQQFKWSDCSGQAQSCFSITILNKLRSDVKNILVYIIFYDLEGFLYDTQIIYLDEILPAGLPKRIQKIIDVEVFKQTTNSAGYRDWGTEENINLLPRKYEIRVVNFEIDE